MDIREKRKIEHIEHSLKEFTGPLSTGFSEIFLVHQALSFSSLENINTKKAFLHKTLEFPLIINAMTGGADGLEVINGKIAKAAFECGVAMAVGSQTAAVKNNKLRYTFDVVRKNNPKGIILANISAISSVQDALEAVEMIEADGIQLHLNIAQELSMPEGERDFRKTAENIINIKEKCSVPIIIKEVGFGFSKETIKKLVKMGINHFDISGAGGTNFSLIEKSRSNNYTNSNIINWGIPTSVSLIETLNTTENLVVCTSGGITTADDILKSIVLGSDIVGMALPILKIIYDNEAKVLVEFLNNLFKEVKELMLLIGTDDLQDAINCPIIITGKVKSWLECRGIDVKKYGMRGLENNYSKI